MSDRPSNRYAPGYRSLRYHGLCDHRAAFIGATASGPDSLLCSTANWVFAGPFAWKRAVQREVNPLVGWGMGATLLLMWERFARSELTTADGKVGDLDVSLDSWKSRAKATANRELTDAQKTRYLLPLPTDAPR